MKRLASLLTLLAVLPPSASAQTESAGLPTAEATPHLPDHVFCEGAYPQHLQGVCIDQEAIYWSFTTALIRTDFEGRRLKQVSVVSHHGDLCCLKGKLYVAVNSGKFNDPQGNADSWVYVYDSTTLKETDRFQVRDVFHGAGGIEFCNGRFFIVGGLPEGLSENYVYEFDMEFRFQKKHTIQSGPTLMGIQTAAFAHDRWWFGCYGDPEIMIVTDADFGRPMRYEFNCSLGIAGLPGGRLLAASGQCQKGNGCSGSVQVVVPDQKNGLRYLNPKGIPRK